MRVLPVAMVLVALAWAPPAAAQPPYKCRDAQGRMQYSDKPCETGAASAPWQRPAPVVVPPLPPVDVSGLPRDGLGRPVVASSPQGAIVLEQRPRGPIQVLAACSALVTRCVKPPTHSLDACMLSAPRCTTGEPWKAEPFVPCCPAACADQYEAARKQGVAPLAAFDRVLYGGDSGRPGCVPATAAR